MATPSGSSVAALNLSLLAHLSGDPRLRERSEDLLSSSAGAVKANPASHAFLLHAVMFARSPEVQVVIAGDPTGPTTRRLVQVAEKRVAPGLVLRVPPDGAERARVEVAAPWVRDLSISDGGAAAYLCRDRSCQRPTSDPDRLQKMLDEAHA